MKFTDQNKHKPQEFLRHVKKAGEIAPIPESRSETEGNMQELQKPPKQINKKVIIISIVAISIIVAFSLSLSLFPKTLITEEKYGFQLIAPGKCRNAFSIEKVEINDVEHPEKIAIYWLWLKEFNKEKKQIGAFKLETSTKTLDQAIKEKESLLIIGSDNPFIEVLRVYHENGSYVLYGGSKISQVHELEKRCSQEDVIVKEI
jgi:hypothetical protein